MKAGQLAAADKKTVNSAGSLNSPLLLPKKKKEDEKKSSPVKP